MKAVLFLRRVSRSPNVMDLLALECFQEALAAGIVIGVPPAGSCSGSDVGAGEALCA